MRESGQMVVELCVVMPVVLMVAVAIIDGLVFTAAASKFEHLSSQAVLAAAAAPAGTQFDSVQVAGEVQELLAQEMGDSRVDVEVGASQSGKVCEFACKMFMRPWPLGSASVFGMLIPTALEHECRFDVRPYVIGEL